MDNSICKPPVGNLRWKNPVPLVNSSKQPMLPEALGCIQDCNLPYGFCPFITSEDCLFLTITAPLNPSSTASLPVYVWLHGGYCLHIVYLHLTLNKFT